MEKVLFVSYNHCLHNKADSIQNHRLIPALSDYYIVDIIQRKVKGMNEGVWSPNVYILDRFLYKLCPSLISVFSIDRWLWCLFTYIKYRKLLHNYTCVIMVYEPYTTRYLHYMFRHRSNVKILSILYDPYVDNVFFSRTKRGLFFRCNVEKKIVNQSDAVVLNSQILYKIFCDRYKLNKFFYIPFCAEPEEASSQRLQSAGYDKVTILHAGNIHGERHLDTLNEIVTKLKESFKGTLSENLQILLYGDCPDVERDKVLQSGNGDIIGIKEYIGQTELKNIKDKCDALLLINPISIANYSYPSKLCEYFQLNKLIFSIGSYKSAANEDLMEAGCIICDENEIQKMSNALLSLIKNRKTFADRTNKDFYKKFLPQNVANEYHNLIQDLL